MKVVVHYGELALKGGNRAFFEDTLAGNIRRSFGKEGIRAKLRKLSGRFLLELPDAAERQLVEKVLKSQFGVASFAFAAVSSADLEALKETAKRLVAEGEGETFRIEAARSDKSYPHSSQEINELVGAYVKTALSRRVDLTHPDVTCFMELVGGEAYCYTERHPGPGGLPLGTSSGALVLLSGGIDSPVAAYFIKRRGAPVDYIHFHSYPYTERASIDKVERIVRALSVYDQTATLYLVPFADVQKAIVAAGIPPALRLILYRRFMLRIAERVARKAKRRALVTGDSLGQVASQTLENIAAISEATTLPILRPLIGFDKDTIVKQAREIGTYDLSIAPGDDVCSRFVPKHPATKAVPEDIERAERALDIAGLTDAAAAQAERI